MAKLISAAEVVAMAFGGENNFRADEIPDASIVAAEQKFIRPVVGDALFASLSTPSRATFVATYLKPALALYVKLLVLPSVAAQTSMTGVVQYLGEGYRSVDAVTFRRLLRRLRSDADTLMDTAVAYIQSNPTLFAEYDPTQNIRNRVRMDGNVIL